MPKNIDDLVAQVTDDSLREKLEIEIKTIFENQLDFGIAFESHKTESVELPNMKISKGSIVRQRMFTTVGKSERRERNDRLFRVLGVNNQQDDTGTLVPTARIFPRSKPKSKPKSKFSQTTTEEQVEESIAVSKLVAVAEFGTPVYPGLKHTGSAVHAKSTAAKDKPSHVVIKGENFHALLALEFTHENSVDCIYIDPPYNTGNEFIYNDKRVGLDDSFRHSKWLSFMERRLDIAKRLLKDTGVIIVAIDDNEHAHLRMLMDKIFGEKNFIGNIPRVTKTTSNKGTHFAPSHDYMLVFGKDISETPIFTVPPTDDYVSLFKLSDNDNRLYKTVGFYMASLIPSTGSTQRYFVECPDGSLCIPPGVSMPETASDGERTLTVPQGDKTWRWGRERYLRERHNLIFRKSSTSPLVDDTGARSEWNVHTKQYLDESLEAGIRPRSFIDQFHNSKGSKLLKNIGIDFSFAKPIELLQFVVHLSTHSSQRPVVLDFFGGSGSTLHAVMEMNAADGGQRQCILVTNNEVESKKATELTKAVFVPGDPEWEAWGVLERVTRPRISTVVTGIRAHLDDSVYSAGLPSERVEFFDLTHEDPGLVRNAYKAIEPLLWLRAGAVGSYEFTNGGTANPVVISSSYAVLHDVNYCADFMAKVNADPTITHVFVVTNSASTFRIIIKSLNDNTVKTMRLYEHYTKTFETNTN